MSQHVSHKQRMPTHCYNVISSLNNRSVQNTQRDANSFQCIIAVSYITYILSLLLVLSILNDFHLNFFGDKLHFWFPRQSSKMIGLYLNYIVCVISLSDHALWF